MNSRQLQKLGVPEECVHGAIAAIQSMMKTGGIRGKQVKQAIRDVIDHRLQQPFLGAELVAVQHVDALLAQEPVKRPPCPDLPGRGALQPDHPHAEH